LNIFTIFNHRKAQRKFLKLSVERKTHFRSSKFCSKGKVRKRFNLLSFLKDNFAKKFVHLVNIRSVLFSAHFSSDFKRLKKKDFKTFLEQMCKLLSILSSEKVPIDYEKIFKGEEHFVASYSLEKEMFC
jgi:hypothetical protein